MLSMDWNEVVEAPQGKLGIVQLNQVLLLSPFKR